MFLCNLNLSVTRTCKFLVCMLTDPFFANKSAKDDVLSLFVILRHLSCSLLILLFIERLWHIHKWAVAKLGFEKSIH